MNFRITAPVAGGLILFAGCASHHRAPAAPAASTSTISQPTNAPAPAPKKTAAALLQEAAAKPSGSFEGQGWISLFDGKTLTGWRETDFAGRGEVQCENGLLVLNMGDPFTWVTWTNKIANIDYEVAFDAMRLAGSDFFCGLTFPVGDSFCSLILGGWGGSLVGISSLDGLDASENETTKYFNFEQNRWYRIRLRATKKKLETWIDDEKLVDVVTTGKQISVRPGDIELSRPFGLASWSTTGVLRQIKMRRVGEPGG